MIYLREFLTVLPATPESHDKLIGLMQSRLLPCHERAGVRLVGAFLNHRENWGQVVHLFELDDLAHFDRLRQAAKADPDFAAAKQALLELAPRQRSELLEPVGPVPTDSLHRVIAESRDTPVKVYTSAELELALGRADEFDKTLAAVKDHFPIVAALRPLAGNPRMVFDLWKGALAQDGYQPATPERMAFFGPLRELAPLEYVVHLYPLPYSPLQ